MVDPAAARCAASTCGGSTSAGETGCSRAAVQQRRLLVGHKKALDLTPRPPPPPLCARCPGGQLTLMDDDSSAAPRCVPSPCSATSCRNGGVCQPLATDSFRCRCADGFSGRRCELGQVKGQRLAALSPSSILAISMCLLVFFGENNCAIVN